MSEKEKDHVIELLLDYVFEIHKQLGLIDQTQVFDSWKNIKMLRITPPKWEDYQGIYQVR